MKIQQSKVIGRKFETWGNEMIEEMGLGRAIRTPGSGSGKIKGDSFNALDFMFEFKSERSPNWKENIKQAKRETKQGNYFKNKWLLIQRDPDTPQANPQAFAIMDYIEFLKLLKKNKEPMIKEPDRETRYIIGNVLIWVKKLEKKIQR